MNRRWSQKRLLSLIPAAAVLAVIVGCDGNQPQPGAAGTYDVIIAICPDRLRDIQDKCDRITKSTRQTVWANVLFGRAGGHTVQIVIETVDGGNARYVAPPDHVPADRTWLHADEIPRSGVCAQSACKVAVHAIVDGTEVAREDFSFVGG
jgi:hypothetical protein